MKRFVISPGTLLLLALVITSSVIMAIPPLRFHFGSRYWDGFALVAYERLGLYRVWYLCVAGVAFFVAGYILSRPQLWRYHLNLWTIRVLDWVSRSAFVIGTYAAARRWLASWYPHLRWQLIARLPASVRTTEAQAVLDLQGTSTSSSVILPLNRRYLAARRAQMDRSIGRWQDLLLRLRWTEGMEGHPQLVDECRRTSLMIADEAWEYFEVWRDHCLSPRPASEGSLGAVCSTLIVLEEQLALARYYTYVTGTGLPSTDRLIREAEALLSMLPTAWRQAALAHFNAVHELQPNEAAGMTNSLESLSSLVKLVVGLPCPEEQTWGAALAMQHVLLEITALVASEWYQEAIQVQFEANTTLEPLLQPQPGLSLSASPSAQPTGLATLFRDMAPAQSFWAAELALPVDRRWSHALLAEAWQTLTIRLDIAIESAADLPNPDLPTASGDGLSPQARQAIRNGYVEYAARKARGHAFACAHPAVWKVCQNLKGDLPSERSVDPTAIQPRINPFGRRTQLLGEVWRVSENRISQWLELFQGQGWRRLGIDPWDRTLIGILGAVCGLAVLLLIGLLHLGRILPAQSARIGDMRMVTDYARSSITSGALAEDDWLVLSTAGQGIQAYHRDSGHWGLWRSFTSATTRGGLLSDTVVQAAGNAGGMWYVVDRGGLSWSTAQLTDWQPVVGVRGFADLRQDEVKAAVLSPDGQYLAVIADRAGLGLYDTRAHDWVGQTALSSPGVALAFQDDAIFVGSASGIASFRVMPGSFTVRLRPDETRSVQGIEVTRFHAGPLWLLAITRKQGLLGLPQTQGARWQWLVGEAGLAAQDIGSREITAVALDSSAIWVAVGDSIGRYDLDSHSWQTTQPDGSPIQSLAIFAQRTWAGTAKGVYRLEAGAWQKIPQLDGSGARQLLAEQNRLWTVTDDGGLGLIQPDSTWKSVISVVPFAQADDTPIISDVAVYKDEVWAASLGHGVASYSWRWHAWTDRRQGLGDVTTVAKLQVAGDGIWALANSSRTASAPHSVWRWAGQNWVPLTDTKGLELTSAAGAAWLLADSGDLLRLSSTQPQRFYQGTSLDPTHLRAFVPDPRTGRVLVAGDEGLFAYALETHNWQFLASGSFRDVSMASGSIVSVTGDGGLIRDQQVVLPGGSLRRFETPMTAAIWRNAVWLSDGQQIAKYTPAAHAMAQDSGIANANILQLRVLSDQLLALGQTASVRHLYRYDASGAKWMQVDPGTDVTAYGIWGTSIITLDSDGAMHVWEQGQNVDYFTGVYAGLQDMTQALKADDGSVWALSPSAGIANYNPARGVWTRADVPRPTSIAVAKNGRGQNVVLAIGSDGLYQQPNPGEPLQRADLSNRPVRAMTQAGGSTFVLLGSPPAIAKWNGLSVDQPTRVYTSTTESALSELVGVANQLWGRQGIEVIAYQPGTLAISTRVPLPSGASESARLVVSEDRLYLGTQTECWQLNVDAWVPCLTNNYLVQSRATITDTYRRFEWQIAPLAVRVSGLPADADHFPSDRATGLQVTQDGLLRVGVTAGTWSGRSATGVSGWSSRSYDASNTNLEVSSPITFTLPGDRWTWIVKANGRALTDTLTISWAPQPNLVRRIVEGRFADENVTAVSFFQDRIWVGTQAGLWTLPGNAASIDERQWITEPGDGKVARLLADSGALYAVMANGQVWRYDGVWQSVSEAAPSAYQVVSDQLGRPLFRQIPSGIETAPFTSSSPRRFRQDQIQSVAGQDEDLWLAAPDTIWHMKPTRDTLVVQSFEAPIVSRGENWRLLADGQGVFARLVGESGARVFRLEGDRAMETDLAHSPFAPGARLSAHLSGVPLSWQRTGDVSVDPGLEIVGAASAITWQQGRLSSDIVNGIALAGDRIYVATQSGALVYRLSAELTDLLAVPDGQLAGEALGMLGPSQEGLWAQSDAHREAFYALSESGGIVHGQRISDKTRVLRSAVVLAGGSWQTKLLPIGSAPLAIEGHEASFAPDGRFRFDHVNDAAISPTGVLVGTDAGVLKYTAAPLRKLLDWEAMSAERIERVATEEGSEYAQASDGVYMRATTSGTWHTILGSRSLLPLGVSLQDAGWQTVRWDPESQEYPIQVVGMERSGTLFSSAGKFLFDEIRGTAQTPTDVWLLTDAGWVDARKARTAVGFELFMIRGGGGVQTGSAVQRVYTDPTGTKLMADGESWRLIWPVTKDRLGPPQREEPINARAMLVTAEFTVRDLRDGLVAIVQRGKDEPVVVTSSLAWFWPFSRPAFFSQPLPAIEVFLEDPRVFWCVTDRELVRIEKKELGLR